MGIDIFCYLMFHSVQLIVIVGMTRKKLSTHVHKTNVCSLLYTVFPNVMKHITNQGRIQDLIRGGAQIVTGLKLPFWGLSFIEFWCWGLIFGGWGGAWAPGAPPWIRPCKYCKRCLYGQPMHADCCYGLQLRPRGRLLFVRDICNTLWLRVKRMPVNFHSNIHIRVIAIFS